MYGPSERARRRRRRRLRRLGSLFAILLIGAALVLFNGISVTYTNHGAAEWLNGQADARSLLLPLLLFVCGVIGLAISLGG